jgi:hypothetical protein
MRGRGHGPCGRRRRPILSPGRRRAILRCRRCRRDDPAHSRRRRVDGGCRRREAEVVGEAGGVLLLHRVRGERPDSGCYAVEFIPGLGLRRPMPAANNSAKLLLETWPCRQNMVEPYWLSSVGMIWRFRKPNLDRQAWKDASRMLAGHSFWWGWAPVSLYLAERL